MLPYLFIGYAIIFYIVAITLMILDWEETKPGRDYIKTRKKSPRKIYARQYIDDVTRTAAFSPLQSTLQRIIRPLHYPIHISTKRL